MLQGETQFKAGDPVVAMFDTAGPGLGQGLGVRVLGFRVEGLGFRV